MDYVFVPISIKDDNYELFELVSTLFAWIYSRHAPDFKGKFIPMQTVSRQIMLLPEVPQFSVHLPFINRTNNQRVFFMFCLVLEFLITNPHPKTKMVYSDETKELPQASYGLRNYLNTSTLSIAVQDGQSGNHLSIIPMPTQTRNILTAAWSIWKLV